LFATIVCEKYGKDTLGSLLTQSVVLTVEVDGKAKLVKVRLPCVTWKNR